MTTLTGGVIASPTPASLGWVEKATRAATVSAGRPLPSPQGRRSRPTWHATRYTANSVTGPQRVRVFMVGTLGAASSAASPLDQKLIDKATAVAVARLPAAAAFLQ